MAPSVDAARLTQGSGGEADALYARRDEPGTARAAVALWQRHLETAPGTFDTAWKLARARYWLGTQEGDEASRRRDLEAGIEAARAAIALRPERPDGHFWLAANMGALAESFGLRQGLRYRGAIKDALERVIAIDPGYLRGSADRALGRWYAKVPGLFGGNDTKAETHLHRALARDAHSTGTLFFLAELYAETRRVPEARAMLQRVLDAPLDPDWTPEDRAFKRRARAMLQTLTP